MIPRPLPLPTPPNARTHAHARTRARGTCPSPRNAPPQSSSQWLGCFTCHESACKTDRRGILAPYKDMRAPERHCTEHNQPDNGLQGAYGDPKPEFGATQDTHASFVDAEDRRSDEHLLRPRAQAILEAACAGMCMQAHVHLSGRDVGRAVPPRGQRSQEVGMQMDCLPLQAALTCPRGAGIH